MLAAARRAPVASTAVFVATSRRHSLWPPRTVHTKRWLASLVGNSDGRDGTTKIDDAIKTHKTPAQKNAREFALLPALLRIYKQYAGHRVVPYHFVIPPTEETSSRSVMKKPTHVLGRVSDVREIPWPEEARGMNFGRVFDKFVRSPKHYETHSWVADALKEMGIPLGDAYRTSVWDQQIMAALRTFYRIHGHTLVPTAFKVPRDDSQWPVATWGYSLGRRVSNLRSRKDHLSEAELADLESVDFSLNTVETMWNDQILPSLETYVRVHDHCLIPQAFEVPRAALWPRKAWGMRLGSVVNGIRSDGTYAAQVERDRQRLEAIGFVWDYFEHSWGEIILPSLEEFYRVNNHSLVPRDFIVPAETPWPREAWGFKLGMCVNNIRSRGDYHIETERDAARLEAIGFATDVSEHKWNNWILPSLETFASQFGDCDVSRPFVIPSELPWPEDAWGLRLGDLVHNMRSKGYFAAEVKRDTSRLEAIGFVWNHFEHQWTHRILPALETFHHLHGHTRVPTKFVVPSESPWPDKLWGLPLGPMIERIRREGTYSDYVKRDAARLSAIGFTTERPSVDVKSEDDTGQDAQ